MARRYGPPVKEKLVAIPHYPDNTRPIRAWSTRDYAAQVSGRHRDAGAIIKVSVPPTQALYDLPLPNRRDRIGRHIGLNPDAEVPTCAGTPASGPLTVYRRFFLAFPIRGR